MSNLDGQDLKTNSKNVDFFRVTTKVTPIEEKIKYEYPINSEENQPNIIPNQRTTNSISSLGTLTTRGENDVFSVESTQAERHLCKYSLNFISHESCIRRGCIYLLSLKVFNYSIHILIILNSIFLIFETLVLYLLAISYNVSPFLTVYFIKVFGNFNF